jgi:hypothetical protein
MTKNKHMVYVAIPFRVVFLRPLDASR